MVSRATTIRVGLLALIWGSGFLWIKLGIRGLSPVEVTLARLVLGSAVLFIVAAVQRGSLPRSPVVWVHITVAALFANAAPYLLFAVGEQHVASATAGMLNATTPLWTVAIALGTRHQRAITARQAAGLVIGFGGAVLIFSPWQAVSGLASIGAIECLAAAASYAVSYVYMDRFLARRGIGPVVLSACQLGAASVWLAIALGVTGAPSPQLDATVVASILILGLAGTGAAYVLNYQIIASVGATVASTVTYLLPAVAIILGFLVLGEHITLLDLAGIALTLAGVALTRKRGRPVRRDRQIERLCEHDVMATKKSPAMRPTDASVEGYLAGVPDERRREDASRLCAMMQEITGERPAMWGTSIIGFGTYHYRYASGHEGDSPLAGFSPRRQHLVIYLVGEFENRYRPVLARLGPHKTGKGCLYIKRLDDVDDDALRELIDRSVRVHRGTDRASG
jgi:drug/metabolite transporter (DMT)-like permease